MVPAGLPAFHLLASPAVGKPVGEQEGKPGDDLSFEDALKRLESIVDSMEGEELPLDSLLAKYEEGSRLSKICQNKLQQAELKIQQLEKNSAGELSVKPANLEN